MKIPYAATIISVLFLMFSASTLCVIHSKLNKPPEVIVEYVGYTNTIIKQEIEYKYIGYTNTIVTNTAVIAPVFRNNGVSTLNVTNLFCSEHCEPCK